MKLLISLSFALLIFSGFALVTPASSFATNTGGITNNSYNISNTGGNTTNGGGSIITGAANSISSIFNKINSNGHDKDKGDDFCKKHPQHRKCHVAVPELGLIPGLVAAGASAGSFYLLKRKKY